MAEQDFYYDDFFASDETPGAEIVVEIRGRQVPFTVKRGASFKDFSEARENATKMRFKPDGKPEIYSYSDFIFGVEVLARCIKSWPFKTRDGQPVPVTREKIAEFGTDGVQAVMLAIQKVTEKGVEALAPFVKDSVDHSSATEA